MEAHLEFSKVQRERHKFCCKKQGGGGQLKYFKADGCDIIGFGWFDFSILHKGVEFVGHLGDRQVFDFAKFLAEVKAGQVVEAADKWLCTVGIEQQFIAGLELYGLLVEFSLFKDSKQWALYLELLRLLPGSDENRIWVSGAGVGHL